MERPLPIISHLSEPFWQAARKHNLVLQKCENCGSYQWYPKAWCINCGSTRLDWEKVTGFGTIYSYTIIRHAKANPAFSQDVPYAIVVVVLDEGPRMYGRLLDYPIEKIEIGTRVKVVFEDVTDSIALPQFTPIEK
jgi:uncharacterized OB-fold protein